MSRLSSLLTGILQITSPSSPTLDWGGRWQKLQKANCQTQDFPSPPISTTKKSWRLYIWVVVVVVVVHRDSHIFMWKLRLLLCDFKPFMNTKWNANFSILGPKNAEKQLKIFFTPILIYGLQWSLVFKINFSWKSQKKNHRVFYFVDVGEKRWFLLKLTFSSLSRKLIWNAKHIWKVAF